MRGTLLEYLKVLNIMVGMEHSYEVIYRYIANVKKKSGGSFPLFTETGLPNLLLAFEELEIPIDPNEPSGHTVNMFKTLNKLTHDFSVLSGMGAQEWEALAMFLYRACRRIHDPGKSSGVGIDQQTNAGVREMLSNPWTITLLLLEVMPVYRPRD